MGLADRQEHAREVVGRLNRFSHFFGGLGGSYGFTSSEARYLRILGLSATSQCFNEVAVHSTWFTSFSKIFLSGSLAKEMIARGILQISSEAQVASLSLKSSILSSVPLRSAMHIRMVMARSSWCPAVSIWARTNSSKRSRSWSLGGMSFSPIQMEVMAPILFQTSSIGRGILWFMVILSLKG